ncbi:MAG TPA: long-chain fatty acid--CoA ligase [Kofleriaceae bacterium]|nr:long-chain fatty acid--CoA ligase [Kofleriaceae bacterium]
MKSTMQDGELTVASLFRHGARVHGSSQVVTAREGGVTRASFAEVAGRAARLASALQRLGVGPGDRVATFAWNTQEHLEAYLAVPCLGAVLHTVNIRLAAAEIAEIIRHAEDRVLIVDHTLLDRIAPLLPGLATVEALIVIGETTGGMAGALRYHDLVAAATPLEAWPQLDEYAAAGLCYTSGTTGTPKGVAYSHRSVYLHSLTLLAADVFGLGERDRVLPVVPMFHASAWGLPYAAWMAGSDLVLPGRAPQAASLARLIADEKPTVAAAVPSIWIDLMHHGEAEPLDLASLRLIACGGAAVPLSLMKWYQERHRVPLIQVWGLTETSPIAAVSLPPADADPSDPWAWRNRTGRVIPGVELRLTDDRGVELPWDDASVGEIEVRGPWVTGEYYRDDQPDKFADGWFKTGDLGRVDSRGYIQITDRIKDVIKSGGEWVSSIALENALVAHPGVQEAAIIGVADPRWQERPLACVVLRDGAEVAPAALRSHLAAHVVRWWIPERWVFTSKIPRTSVGKIDKKELRLLYQNGRLGRVVTARDTVEE